MTANTLTAWSYSRLALYEMCPFAFKCKNIDKLPDPPGPAMDRGNKIHKEMANYVTAATASCPDVLAPSAKGSAFKKLCSEIRSFPADDRVVEQQWGFTKAWKATGWFGKETWWRVVLDVGVVYPDNTAEVIDWKTGKKYATNEDQMSQFAVATVARFPHVTHVSTRLVYLDTGQEEFAEFSAAQVPSLKLGFEKRVAQMLGDTTFPARPNDKCKWCNFSKDKGGPCRFS